MLPLHGDTASFSALVARYSGDITLGAILDELIRIGVVSRDSRDRVHLESLGYIPQEDELEKIRGNGHLCGRPVKHGCPQYRNR